MNTNLTLLEHSASSAPAEIGVSAVVGSGSALFFGQVNEGNPFSELGSLESKVLSLEPICAWCPDSRLKTQDSKLPASHGICPACAEKMLEELV